MWEVYSEWGEIRHGAVVPMGGEVLYRGYDRMEAKVAFAKEVARLKGEGFEPDPYGVLDEEVEAVVWLRKGDELALVLLRKEEEEE